MFQPHRNFMFTKSVEMLNLYYMFGGSFQLCLGKRSSTYLIDPTVLCTCSESDIQFHNISTVDQEVP